MTPMKAPGTAPGDTRSPQGAQREGRVMLSTVNIIPRRQLSAIMFVDMVGYSALMAGDEETAYRTRTRYRQALDQATERHHGEVVQHYGDGALVLFRSAVEASRAAVAVQSRLREEPAVPVRIGIHQADVVRDADGAYGSGVNVAARIEALAVPGSVVVSDRVARELHNMVDLETLYLGDFSLKNIPDLMSLHALAHPDLVTPRARDLRVAPVPRQVVAPSARRERTCAPAPTKVAGLAGLLYEAHRRRVDQVAALYAVAVVVIVTLLELLGPSLGLSLQAVRAALVAGLLGLPLTLRLAWIYDLTPSGISRTGPSGLPRHLRQLAGGSVLVLSGLAAVAVVRAPGLPGVPPQAGVRPDALAVLPLNAVGETDEHLTEGLHESLVTRLSREDGLSVVSRASVTRVGQAGASAPALGRMLNAGLIVEGCVQQVGDRVVVQIRLVDAGRDEQIWSAEFDRAYSPATLLDLEREIADTVARGVSRVLAPDADAQNAAQGPAPRTRTLIDA